MPISFNQVPSQIRVPFLYAEFDNTRAIQGLTDQPYKILMIGQKLAAGTKSALEPVRVTSADQAAEFFGNGSHLHLMARGNFANNQIIETVCVAIDDPGSAVAADGTITLTGTPTQSGTLSLYVAGERVQVLAEAADTVTTIATRIAAAINAATYLPVTATSAAGVVTVTAKNKGLVGNDIDIRLNYFDEETPAGLTVAITAMADGAGAPDLDTVWAALGEEQYILVCGPYNDSASIASIREEFAERDGPTKQIDSVYITAFYGTHSEATTIGEAPNSKYGIIVPTQKSPTFAPEYAAMIVGVVANSASIDPARPFQTLTVQGARAPSAKDQYNLNERNLHLYDGLSTTTVNAGGEVVIERLITTYRKNNFGADDASYLDLNTILTLSYIRYSFRTYFLQKYPRHKLANDGTRFGAGQAIMTPKVAKGECAGIFRNWETNGLVEGFTQFMDELIVERNAEDANRLDFMLPTDLVNQLRVMGVQIQFLL